MQSGVPLWLAAACAAVVVVIGCARTERHDDATDRGGAGQGSASDDSGVGGSGDGVDTGEPDAAERDAAGAMTDAGSVPADGSGPEVDALLEMTEGPCTSSMPLRPYTIHVDASGLAQAENTSVTVYTEMSLAWGTSCAARGTTVVTDASFALDVTGLSDGAAYPTVAIWVDVDGDGLCELSEDLVHREIWTVGERASRSFTATDFVGSVERAQACDPFGGDHSADDD